MINTLVADFRLTFLNFKHEIILEKEIDLMGNKELLIPVFNNLLINALKFSSVNAKPQIIISSFTNSNNREIVYIKDNGIGFEESESKSIFLPYHRTPLSGTFDGQGLGLATAQQIIRAHNGRIWAEGKPGLELPFISIYQKM